MPTAATAIAAAASQPRALSKGCRANSPMICLHEAISMITIMIGTAATPFMAALQNKALIGSSGVKFRIAPIEVANAIVP